MTSVSVTTTTTTTTVRATTEMGGMSASDIVSATGDLRTATRYMSQIGDFAEQCVSLINIGDTSRLQECATAMSDLGPVLEAYIDAHPIVDELS